MEGVFNRIVELVNENNTIADDKFVKFSDLNYESFPLDKNNFKTVKNDPNHSKIAFVDGGSATILDSANFSLSLIRIYTSIYDGRKRISSGRKDFYIFTKAKEKDNELFYDAEVIGTSNLEKEDLLLSSFDETIKQGITRAKISNVANVVRRFSELIAAKESINDLGEGDVIVLDGSLQCTFTNERKYMDRLFEAAKEKKVTVSGLSKTTTLMTDKGNSVNNALNKFKIGGKWLYHPVVDIKSEGHKAEMCFVKLHEKSKYVFRFEVYKEQKERLKEAVDLLSSNCKDPVFLGYPYGLIEADKNARISNQEKAMLKTLVSVKFGKEWENIENSLTSLNAHKILDGVN